MHLDPQDRHYKDLYKLLAALVVPRPIAVVTTLNDDGSVNIAPYSFFNILIESPPIVAFGAGIRPNGKKKDSIRNIDNSREFVINLMAWEHLHQLHACSEPLAPDESELPSSGFSLATSERIAVPRLAEARVSFECVARNSMMASEHCYIISGEIIYIHVDDAIIDPETDYVDLEKYDPVGRLYGGNFLRVKTADRMQLNDPWIKPSS